LRTKYSMSNSVASIGIVILLSLLLLGACKGKRDITAREYPPIAVDELVELTAASRLDFEHFSAKVSADVKAEGRSNSFRATLRIRRDSAIWVSVSPALGIEVFRLLCTQDSVLYIDKMKNEYFRGTYAKLNELTNSELTLQALQDILVGNPLYFNSDLKYRSRNDARGYQLSTRNVNLLRRVVSGSPGDALTLPVDSTGETINEKRLFRMQERMDDDDLIVRQYWMHYTLGKIVQTVFTDLSSALYLSAVYSDHELVDGLWIPSKAMLELGNTKEQATFRLSYSRIKLNTPAGMPFSIPDKYDEVLR